jgi:hypothetical protein
MKEINPTDVYDELFNVTILGTPKSGKKALLSKFINGVVFPIDFINVTLTIDSKSIKLRIYLIDDLWSLRSCNAAIVCCDLTKKEQEDEKKLTSKLELLASQQIERLIKLLIKITIR